RPLRVFVPGLVPVTGLELVHLLGVEPDERVRSDKSARARGVLRRVPHRHDASMRVPEQVELLLAEVDAQLLHVGHVVRGRVRARILRRRRPSGAARVEQDESERLAQAADVGEISRREPRAAGMAHEHRPAALAAVGQRPPVLRVERLGPDLFFPTTTRSLPARSGTILTSYPSDASISPVSFACASCVSSTSGAPGSSTSRARRASSSACPSSTSASRGSQSRTSGSSESISSARTYGGLETTRSNGPGGRPRRRSWCTSS